MTEIDVRPVRRALVSIYDKTGLAEFVTGLHEAGVELVIVSAQERAALEWTEALTQLSPHGVPDAIFMRDIRVGTFSDGGLVSIAGAGIGATSPAACRTPTPSWT